MELEFPSLSLKQYPKYSEKLFYKNTCSMAVNYWIYDTKRKTIVDFGSSKPCGYNKYKSSIHAEQYAINYCRKVNNSNKLKIIIWRWDKKGKIKSAFCCFACLKIINKYNYQDKIFTIENNKMIKATESPYISLGYKLKYDS